MTFTGPKMHEKPPQKVEKYPKMAAFSQKWPKYEFFENCSNIQ